MMLPPSVAALLRDARDKRKAYYADPTPANMRASGDAFMKARTAVHDFVHEYVVGSKAAA